MIRELADKITRFFAERSHSARKGFNVPIKISFEPLKTTGKLPSSTDNLYITGETNDLSGTGIGFVVSSIRVRENYLVGQDRRLNVEIDLPGGKIQMKVIGRRYEKVGQHLSTEKFLIGAEIVEIGKTQREAYEHFLRYGNKHKKAAAPSFEMGTD